jgi:hypothetical protein
LSIGHRTRNPRFDRAAYRKRNRIEHPINRLKQSRRIAALREKCAVNHHAMLPTGMVLPRPRPFADTI